MAREAGTVAVAATTMGSAGTGNSRVERVATTATTAGTAMETTVVIAVVATAAMPAAETMAASNEITHQITLDRVARYAGSQDPKACSRRSGLKVGGKPTWAMSPPPGNVMSRSRPLSESNQRDRGSRSNSTKPRTNARRSRNATGSSKGGSRMAGQVVNPMAVVTRTIPDGLSRPGRMQPS